MPLNPMRRIVCLAALSLTAHAAFTTAAALALDQTDLDTNRSVWDSQSASDYDYFLQRSCFCFPDTIRPGLVSVRSGVITTDWTKRLT